jgi:hypothetical protein
VRRKIEQVGWDEDMGGRLTKKQLAEFNAAANKYLRSKGEKIGWKETVIPKSIQKSAKKKD